jgi:hypothetical protein
VRGGKPIAVLLQSISGVSAIIFLVAFYDILEERERCHPFILSRTTQETLCYLEIKKLHYFQKLPKNAVPIASTL